MEYDIIAFIHSAIEWDAYGDFLKGKINRFFVKKTICFCYLVGESVADRLLHDIRYFEFRKQKLGGASAIIKGEEYYPPLLEKKIEKKKSLIITTNVRCSYCP